MQNVFVALVAEEDKRATTNVQNGFFLFLFYYLFVSLNSNSSKTP